MAHRTAKEDVRQQELNFNWIALTDLAKAGFWFCNGCSRIVEVDTDSKEYNCCAECGSPRIKYNEPVA